MIRVMSQLLSSVFGHMRPEALVISTFAVAIVIGTFLLWMPASHRGSVGFPEAIFTATSAVCVTGLVVVDTGTDFTLFGQFIILSLIQLGGLGVMTFAALAFQLLGRRLSLIGQAAMTDALVHDELNRGFHKFFHKILFLQISIEIFGAIALFLILLPTSNKTYAAYSAIFHSISAFCNAGFSLYADSLVGLRKNTVFVGIIAILVVIGGIGFPVIFDIVRIWKTPRKRGLSIWLQFTIHTRITLLLSAILLLSGAILILLTAMPVYGFDLSAAFFQSVVARTAGFNTVFIGLLPLPSLIVLIILMFIGGSPGSCAGGVKTTTVALWISQLFNRIQGRTSVVIQDRYIPQILVNRSATIISFAILYNIIGILILSISETGADLYELLFEQVSAFGTVGLSTGITSDLSDFGRLWIMLTMFIGRTGPLTGVILLLHRKPVAVKYPEGKVMIG